MFSESSPCWLGQHGSCSSAQLPVELSEIMLQNLFLNLLPHSVFASGSLEVERRMEQEPAGNLCRRLTISLPRQSKNVVIEFTMQPGVAGASPDGHES